MVTAHNRGQAMVETALGVLVFVTILVFGIHFAEIGFVSLKVQEASASAIWDATQAKMHVLPGNFSGVQNLISGDVPGKRATSRYQDFDGRTSKSGGGGALTYVFTRAEGLEVTCQQAGEISFKPAPTTESVYSDVGGMGCSSQATLGAYRFPKRFVQQDGNGFFQKEHYELGPITICGVGRANGGSCQGQFGILLDDYGLAVPEESQTCEVLSKCSANQPYFTSAQRVYEQHGWAEQGAAMELAEATVGESPINSSEFWMGFMTYNDNSAGGEGRTNWPITPGEGSPTEQYDQSYSKRENCWLGLKCEE